MRRSPNEVITIVQCEIYFEATKLFMDQFPENTIRERPQDFFTVLKKYCEEVAASDPIQARRVIALQIQQRIIGLGL